ncbi:MAG: protein-disulfide reductase DsbD domain-containing protein, partial [Methylotenera sp.]
MKATYQGCSEKGLCYAPQHKTFTLSASSVTDESPATASSSGISDNDSQAADLLKSGKWWLIILGFF